jgi:MFS transporter, SP family, arabinose:H+ symporter
MNLVASSPVTAFAAGVIEHAKANRLTVVLSAATIGSVFGSDAMPEKAHTTSAEILEAGNRAGRGGYVLALSAAAALAGLLFGFDTAVINGALVFLKDDFRLSNLQTEFAASSLLFGCLAGSAVAGSLSDRYGRRRLLRVAALLFCVSSVWTALPSGLAEFAAARLSTGIAIGVASVLAPLYIAEISPPGSRGRLVTLNQMAIVTGILASYLVNWMLSGLGPGSWRWMFAVAAVPSLAFFLALLFIPESPRWLLRWNRTQEAMAILNRTVGPEAAGPVADAVRASIAEESGGFREVFAPHLRKPLMAAMALAVLSQVTGINTVIYYGSVLFKEHAGSGSASGALGANVIIGMVNFVGTIVAIALIDKVGRKPLLLCGASLMAVTLGGVAAAFGMSPIPANLVLGLILAYVGSFAISLGPGTWLYISELFPTAVRGRAMSVATLSLWTACTLVTFTFLSLVEALGPAGTFLIYGSLCVVTVVYVRRCLPETKGRTLEEIQQTWKRR